MQKEMTMFNNFTALANVFLAAIPMGAIGFAALMDAVKMI
jgi:hypothetical protein